MWALLTKAVQRRGWLTLYSVITGKAHRSEPGWRSTVQSNHWPVDQFHSECLTKMSDLIRCFREFFKKFFFYEVDSDYGKDAINNRKVCE